MSQNRGSAVAQKQQPPPPQTYNAEASKKKVAEMAAAAKDQLIELLALYLASQPSIVDIHKENEVEVRFGTRGKPLTKIDYNNIIKKLLSEGFTTDSADGEHYLRIFSEFINPDTGRTLVSDNIRTEIRDLYLIQEYCRTNSIQKLLNMPQQINHQKIKFTQKRPAKTAAGENLRDVLFPDFNYSVSFKTERDFSTNTDIGRAIIRSWEDNKKTFRFINRVRFSHPDYPIFVDVSIVKSSKMTSTTKRMIPTNTIDEAGVFSNQERYEVELEIDNSRIPLQWNESNIQNLLNPLRTCIRIVLSGLQGSNYPIGNAKQNEILQNYMQLIHGQEYQGGRVFSRHFLGPSTYTLQLSNVVESPTAASTASTDIPNIRRNYSVTDKADGERKMMYIDKHGAIYLIDINMKVTFTGAYTKTIELHNTLIDGEHILHDKNGKYINLYAAFDIYYIHERDIRTLPFALEEQSADHAGKAVEQAPTVEEIREGKKLPSFADTASRIDVLRNVMQILRPKKTLEPSDENPCDMTFICKDFYWGGNIFSHCNTILSKIADGTYKYKTDGIIFTPINLPVGGVPENLRPPNEKRAWKYSLKWKKPEDNTIDFLVMIKKTATNDAVDEIFHIFGKGENLAAINDTSSSISQYKTLELRCGYNPKIHGYIDPWNTLIEGNFSSTGTLGVEDEGIQPAIFKPTDPSMKNAHLCNIKLQSVDGLIKTEECEVIEDHMIVEFSYDMGGETGEEASRGPEWRWIPKRIRYDKTSEYRAGGKNYGNAYHVANSNWYSIHHPITETMIMTGEGIPNFINDDIYYNNSELSENLTRSKRDFHNLFVKRRLLTSVAKPKDTLIDYAVGKGGDIPKWAESRLSFVFGVDLYADNIQNRFDGACARYLNKRRGNKNIFRAMFVRGNSSLNIRSAEAMVTEKEKQITRAVFGRGEKDADKLGRGVYDVYGEGADGFNISSCQFALHYFFESEVTLHNFVRNVAECTKLGGCFIGTCYDGEEIFNLLRNKLENESIAFFTTATAANESKKICEIIKRYSYTGFSDDFHSVGYKIDVYQESINQILSEYLVNFQYLVKIMEMYGFELDIHNQDIAGGTQMFKSLYKKMEDESKMDRKKRDTYSNALKMSEIEKQDSFLNRCFVFRKIHEVNAEKVMNYILKERKEQRELEMEYLIETPKTEKIPVSVKAKPRKAPAPAAPLRKHRKKVIIEDVITESSTAPPPEPEPEPEKQLTPLQQALRDSVTTTTTTAAAAAAVAASTLYAPVTTAAIAATGIIAANQESEQPPPPPITTEPTIKIRKKRTTRKNLV